MDDGLKVSGVAMATTHKRSEFDVDHPDRVLKHAAETSIHSLMNGEFLNMLDSFPDGRTNIRIEISIDILADPEPLAETSHD